MSTGKWRFFYLLVLMAMVGSCSVERKIGREYLKLHRQQSVMISPADLLYRYNKGAVIDTLLFRSLAEQDSMAYEQSIFLKHVSDSIFLEQFTNSLIKELGKLGYDVMLDASADLFFSRPQPAWIVHLAQLQLEENYDISYLYNDPENEDRPVPNKIFAINLNAWIETTPVNNENTRKQMLYAGMGIQESVHNLYSFSIFSGEFTASYQFDRIDMDDIYKMASQCGQAHARLLFDYFLNDYVRRNMPAGSDLRMTLHYNPESRMLTTAESDRYDVVQ